MQRAKYKAKFKEEAVRQVIDRGAGQQGKPFKPQYEPKRKLLGQRSGRIVLQ